MNTLALALLKNFKEWPEEVRIEFIKCHLSNRKLIRFLWAHSNRARRDLAEIIDVVHLDNLEVTI
jgi:hypothetical protein